MRIESGAARIAAGAIALVAWAALVLQFNSETDQGHSDAGAVWIILRYLTVVTNLMAAVVLTGIALGQSAFRSQRLLGLLALSILFVGAVYFVLLRGSVELSGGALIANTLLHYAVPSLTPLFWLLFAPKDALRWRDPLLWAIYPLIYFAYALTRGASDGKYPYPFMDIPKVGWPAALTTVAIILVVYLVVGLIFVWLGRRIGGSNGKAISSHQP